MPEQRITTGKAVYITYTIHDDEGVLRERYDMPICYIHGANSGLFEQIEKSLEGHRVDDEVVVELTADQAFGQPDPDLIVTDKIENVPPEFRVVGAEPVLEGPNGETINLTVTKIEDGIVTLDRNHPLAGKDITFTVVVTQIRDATREEMVNGRPAEGSQPH